MFFHKYLLVPGCCEVVWHFLRKIVNVLNQDKHVSTLGALRNYCDLCHKQKHRKWNYEMNRTRLSLTFGL